MLASKIFCMTVSFSSVPIPKVPSSSSLTFTSLCKNFQKSDSLDYSLIRARLMVQAEQIPQNSIRYFEAENIKNMN